jgi:hypothetical protein
MCDFQPDVWPFGQIWLILEWPKRGSSHLKESLTFYAIAEQLFTSPLSLIGKSP